MLDVGAAQQAYGSRALTATPSSTRATMRDTSAAAPRRSLRSAPARPFTHTMLGIGTSQVYRDSPRDHFPNSTSDYTATSECCLDVAHQGLDPKFGHSFYLFKASSAWTEFSNQVTHGPLCSTHEPLLKQYCRCKATPQSGMFDTKCRPCRRLLIARASSNQHPDFSVQSAPPPQRAVPVTSQSLHIHQLLRCTHREVFQMQALTSR